MKPADLAAKAVRAISKHGGKRLAKKVKAPPISEHNLKTVRGKKYFCGFASCEVMPDDLFKAKHFVAGHGPGHKVESVHDPITASAMWLGCDDNGGIVILSVDCVGLTRVEVTRVRDLLSGFVKKSGCKSVNICCTHTHAGFDTVGYWGNLPKTGKNEAYMNKLLTSLADIAVKAYENRKPGRLFVGDIRVPDAQHDGREPIVLNDYLTKISFHPDDGTAQTWLLNFAAHPNTLGGANRTISADYPYYMRERIREKSGAGVLFGVGAIGAVDPGEFSQDRVERTRLQGERLGDAALAVDNDSELECEISVLRQPFYIPVDNSVLAFLASLGVMSSKRYPDRTSSIGVALKTEMTYICLGSLQILLLPGESFPETVYGGYSDSKTSATGASADINSRPLTEIAENKKLLVFGVTNDMTGYVVPPNDFVLHETQPYLSNGTDRFGRRHYHETNSMGVNTSHVIAQVFESIMQRVKKSKEQ